MNKSISYIPCILLLLILILFIISRVGNLSLPFYWDEAWSYATAIFDMAGNKLAILPGDANSELTRGHPLLFYFLSALWVKVFGVDPAVVHLFPLLISIAMLIAVFLIARDLFDNYTAVAALLLFVLQPFFLAQGTQLLPEVMLALWTILTVYSYFRKKWSLFISFSILLIMTKETGIVLIGTLFFDKLLLERLFSKDAHRSGRLTIRELLIMCIPVFVFAALMMIQKIRVGWLLYPDHLKMATLDPHEILIRFRIFLSKLLFQHGRNVFFFLSAGAFVYLLFKKSILKQSMHFLLFFISFIVFYITFSSINFFTTRYLLSVLPFFIVSGTWLICKALENKTYLQVSVIALLACLFSWYSFKGYHSESDSSLAYKNTVLLQKQAVNYAEEMKWHHASIYSAFLMQYYLSDPNMGYLNNKALPFTDIANKSGEKYDIYLFCSNENDPLHASIINNKEYYSINKFERNGAWVEFFSRKEY